ncbi:MAG TPA: hypothetical protein VGM47_11480 [Gammaproteobacteria bacterium]
MRQRYGLLTLLTILVLAASGLNLGMPRAGLPFVKEFRDAHTVVISRYSGTPLPEQLQDGDEIDLDATPFDARVALYTSQWDNLPAGRTYDLAVRRAGGLITVPVTSTVSTPTLSRLLETQGLNALSIGPLFSIIALILLWRGRERSARMMTWWAVAYVVAVVFEALPLDGVAGLAMLVLARGFYLVGRLFFYVMTESMVGTALTPRSRWVFRAGFALMFLAGSTWAVGGPVALAVTGELSVIHPAMSLFYSMIYVVPTIMFFMAYRTAEAEPRLRLRWMLWSTSLFLMAVVIRNIGYASPIGYAASYFLYFGGMMVAMLGFMYAVLKHRIVDVAVAIDRTLVYGGVTTLVVGIIAAMNSLALRATLGEGAGLLLQIVVPLSLGIVLGRVRTYMDMLVERVFFRSRYLADQALRSFARRCGHIGNIGHLFESTAREIRKQTHSPGIAIYTASSAGYVRVQQVGEIGYPARVDMDDPALVAVRADLKAVDLAALDSALGADGCAFPMVVLGVERGVIVCANRPGERFPSDERALLGQVASDVGAAWRILWARQNEEFVRTVAHGQFDMETAKAKALSLETAWAGT